MSQKVKTVNNKQIDNKSQSVVPKRSASSIVFGLFRDWQDFALTSLGFSFTIGVVILGVAAFIILSQFDMPITAAIIFAGAVFGDLALGLIGGKLKKHGFFACCDSEKKEAQHQPLNGLSALTP